MNRRNMKTRKLFNKMIMVHITINSLRNKFDMLSNSVTEYKDMPMISETKLDDTFPEALSSKVLSPVLFFHLREEFFKLFIQIM